MTSYIIGIDLGTTHSCVAVYENNSTEILVNKLGQRTTPSWVACNDEGQVVGEPAKEQAVLEPENTVYDIKRLIGLQYDNQQVQKFIQNWRFTVKNDNQSPKVKVKWNGKTKKFKPQEISAIVLRELKSFAEEYLDREVTKAVITVPAYFNDSQRYATMEAGKIAGLEVVRLLNEPTAAALAYTVRKNGMRGTVLVFDLGGGTLDVSIVTITDARFVVRATKGNSHLGGQDFTKRLLDYMIGLLNRNFGKTKVTNNKNAMARMEQECEKAKVRLSFAPKVKIFIDSIVNGKNFNEEITREKFCTLNADLFELALEPIKDALHAANMTRDAIDKVIMVGGSSRIPKIQEKLSQFFENKEICSSINPDEAIAAGAAIYAAIYDGVKIRNRTNLTIEDVIPRSLGIAHGKNSEQTAFVIEKNSAIPISKHEMFSTSEDNQTGVTFAVYEGDSPHTKDNTLLGQFVITDVPSNLAGVEKFDVIFTVDSNGLLKVSATNISTGNEMKITIRGRIGCKFD